MILTTPSASSPAHPRPLDVLWQGPTIMWVILAGEGLAAVLALSPGVGNGRWVYFGLASLIVQWIAFLALASLYLLRRQLRGMKASHVVYLALAMLLASAWLVVGALWWLLRGILPAEDANWQQLLLRFSGIVVIVGLLGVAALQNHWRARQLAVRAKQAELEALQARIRPHFLFNTLNSGVALVRQQPEQAEQLLLGLADLFRAALANPHDIELGEEIALTQRYLEIEAIRFGPRLRVRWDLPEPLPLVKVPALSIQPLVENAVRHGIERLPEGGEIDIAVAVRENAVVVTIRNRIATSNLDGEARGGHSIGIKATQARLHASTGGRGSLVSSQRDGDYIVEMTLPL
ncbi:MAG: sensor histidine kinase [Luteimonas sp.]